MKRIILSLAFAAAASPHVARADRIVATTIPVWTQQGPSADSLYRAGRAALNNDRYREAERQFGELLRVYPRSSRSADATMYRAMALFRIGGRGDLTAAYDELEQYGAHFLGADRDRDEDVQILRTRICGEMARDGDSRCGRQVAEQASAAARPGRATASSSGSGGSAGAGSSSANTGPGSRASGGPGTTRGSARAGRNNNDNNSDDDDLGMLALSALQSMNSEQAVPLLKQVLARRDAASAKKRAQAVRILSQKSSSDISATLLDVAKNDPSAEVRGQAVFWLSQSRDARAVDVLQELLTKPSNDAQLQDQAIFALSQIGSTRAMQILRDFAVQRGGSVEARGKAIFWLGQNKGGGSVDFLRDLYGQVNDAQLKGQIISSLGQSGAGKPLLSEIARNSREGAEQRKQAIFWMSQSGGSSADLSALYGTLDDHELRSQVIFALTQVHDGGSIDKLIDIARNDKDKELRKSAIFWLGQSNDARAARYLKELIDR